MAFLSANQMVKIDFHEYNAHPLISALGNVLLDHWYA